MVTASPRRTADLAVRYEICVSGEVSGDAVQELAGVEMCAEAPRTVLTGTFRDQSELHGFLARLRSLHLDVVELHRLSSATDAPEDE